MGEDRWYIYVLILTSVEHLQVIITAGPLEELPYDLRQQWHKICLSLHKYFPNLVYPILQNLTPYQIKARSKVLQPMDSLGRQKTMEFMLRLLFDADPMKLSLPYQLISWLMGYSQSSSPLRDFLVERLVRYLYFLHWNPAEIISEPQTFSAFL